MKRRRAALENQLKELAKKGYWIIGAEIINKTNASSFIEANERLGRIQANVNIVLMFCMLLFHKPRLPFKNQL